ncbi:MAG: uroporphyrinogen decarboxylase family protein [Thermofilaceae archaeon]
MLDKPNFERLRSVLYLEEPQDRVPLYDLYADPEVVETLTGERLAEGPSSVGEAAIAVRKKKYLRDAEHNARVLVKFYLKLGYDYVTFSIPTPFPRSNVQLANDTAPLRRPKRVWNDERRGVIETREDFIEYVWPEVADVQETFLTYYAAFKRELPEGMEIIPLTPGGVFENVVWLMGTVPFSRTLYRDPVLAKCMSDRVGKVLEYICKIASECDSVGAVTMGDDMGYRSGPMVSPSALRQYVFPWQRSCAEAVHRHDKLFILHSCGNLKVIMDDLINYVRIDAKHSYEDVSYPVTEYKELYGSRIAILGGVDMDKLSRMPTDLFTGYVKEVLRACAPGGGYALGCGNSVANYIRIENYLTMIEIGKKYGRYPLR